MMRQQTKFLEDGYLGRMRDGSRVFLSITRNEDDRTAETVDHQTVTGCARLSFMGAIIEKGRRTAWTCGQVQSNLSAEAFIGGEPLLPIGDLRRLLGYWDRWHLNDLHSTCCHQPAQIERRDVHQQTISIPQPEQPVPGFIGTAPVAYVPHYETYREAWARVYADYVAMCPQGYVPGTRHLVEIVPDAVWDDIAAITDRLKAHPKFYTKDRY